MITKRNSNSRLVKLIFGCFFGIIVMFSGVFGIFSLGAPAEVYAVPGETEVTETNTGEANTGTEEAGTENNAATGASCEQSLGALGWLVCPTTGKISEAVDWLYDKIEDILVINPVFAEDGQPIYEIWKYFRGITNIVFIIFLLVVIYSQLTGVGISNYGLKRSLPKLIVAAVLVNLSFIICSLLVDVSNIIGNGLRGLFESIEAATMSSMTVGTGGASHVAMAEMYSAMAGGTALAIGGGMIAFEAGAIWMLIPVALGAIVSVAAGLITIAMRQAVVALLVMIAPLAMVAYMLPNTEKWFKQWKELLTRMLVFYPAFSLLFGASSLAGWAIIVSASDGFGLLLGTAVQIFPLFFAWKLMKMSGTFLSAVNAGLHRIAAGPLATNKAWAGTHRDLTRARNLARKDAYTPSLKLRQFLENRKVERAEELAEHQATIKNRGLEYTARRHYKNGDLDGTLSKRGLRSYEDQARNMEYQRGALRHKNNMEKGFGYRAKAGSAEFRNLDRLDMANVNASDMLKAEQARTERINYENAVGFHKRMEEAMNAHMDERFRNLKDGDGNLLFDDNGNIIERSKYMPHFDSVTSKEYLESLARYTGMKEIMEGSLQDVQYVAATAAQAYDVQAKAVMTKFQKYFELVPPTRDVQLRLQEFSIDPNKKAVENIDAIIAGLRIINMRGDTDIVQGILDDVLDEGVDLGTHASQSLASFLMFDVKDNDPFLRRFGKYINLETAAVYNSHKRKQTKVTFDEYITGEYEKASEDESGMAKRPMKILMEGTSLDNVERTAYRNFDERLKKAYRRKGENGEDELDVEGYLAKRDEIQTAIGPQFISASLKYLSGSEQLKSAVKFLTGYDEKDGELKAAWDDKIWEDSDATLNDAQKKEVEEYYRKKVQGYFKDQTPAQILGMRSDYKNPITEHMTKAWLEEHPDEAREYNAKMAEIQTMYGDLPADEAAKKRKMDIAKLKAEITGKQVRSQLSKSGKLKQIYSTRRSGAANNAKDWMRDWLNLDDETEINRYLKDNAKKVKEEVKAQQAADPDYEPPRTGAYTEDDMLGFMNEIDIIHMSAKDLGEEDFYNETMEKLHEWFGRYSYIAHEYKEFYENNPTADSYELREYLKSLLGDLDNYND